MLSRQRLDYAAQRWASAAVSIGLVEKIFHSSIDPLVVIRRNDQGRRACVLLSIDRSTIIYRMREQNTRLLPTVRIPIYAAIQLIHCLDKSTGLVRVIILIVPVDKTQPHLQSISTMPLEDVMRKPFGHYVSLLIR